MCVSRQKPRLEAASRQQKVLPQPRLYVWMPHLGLASPRGYCLGLASVSTLWPRPHLGLVSSALPQLEASEPLFSKLRYDIIIYNFHPFILFISLFQLHEAGEVMVIIKINIVVSCHTVLRI